MSTIRDTGYRDELAKLTSNLRRFARALVHDHGLEAADDLVQATLVAALAADQSRRGSRLLVWLMSTLVVLHRNHAREATADKVSARGGISQNMAGRTGHWDLSRPARKQDAALLGSMPIECREVLLLVTLEGFSYAQVAESLEIPLTTVVSRLAKAREHLAQAQRGETAATKPAAAGSKPRATVPYLRVVK